MVDPCHTLCTSYHMPGIIWVDGWTQNNCNSASWVFWQVYIVFSINLLLSTSHCLAHLSQLFFSLQVSSHYYFYQHVIVIQSMYELFLQLSTYFFIHSTAVYLSLPIHSSALSFIYLTNLQNFNDFMASLYCGLNLLINFLNRP